MIKRGVFIFALLALCSSSHAGLYIGSWNTKHLGWADEKRDWGRTVGVVAAYDFIALQEVHSPEVVSKLEVMLEKRTKMEWTSITSDSGVGRTRYKEQYAFLWRSDAVAYLGGAVTYLDPGDKFEREPFAANFGSRDGRYEWTAATVHIIYGKDKSAREDEVEELKNYVVWLRETINEGRPLLLMGDFNLAPSNPAWDKLDNLLYPLIVDGATTLAIRNGAYSSLYDNILVDGTLPVAGVFIDKYPLRLNVAHEVARDTISDHAPVGLVLE